ncbi:branched-chain amino acid ABC transporter permease [Nocardioides sp. GXZ039]|uniref:branched-chain amino acid ABC transporter permease n=1 Tax=Nocardioides sp. GXZ039 TaxID=3136018 RepID=UPI0030F395CA
MSDVATTRRAGRVTRALGWAAIPAVVLLPPYWIAEYWLGQGSLVFAAAIGAVGLTLLFGRVGQLSLGHPFFLALGAYTYTGLASEPTAGLWGQGLPSPLAAMLAALLAGLVGLLLSPIAARLKGLSLGLATLSLVFIGQWLLSACVGLTGGFNGRPTPPLQIGSLSSLGSDLAVLGVPIGGAEFMWAVTSAVFFAVAIFTANLLRGRTGRAFTAIKEAELHADILGIEVARYRAVAFAISSAFAGLGGALLAVLLGYIVPEYWGLSLAVGYLAMTVIGGLGSITGAFLGAAFVTLLPAILQRYGDSLPGLAAHGGGGITPATAAELLYAVALIGVLLVEPRGLVAIGRRLLGRWSSARRARARDVAGAAGAEESSVLSSTPTSPSEARR